MANPNPHQAELRSEARSEVRVWVKVRVRVRARIALTRWSCAASWWSCAARRAAKSAAKQGATPNGRYAATRPPRGR